MKEEKPQQQPTPLKQKHIFLIESTKDVKDFIETCKGTVGDGQSFYIFLSTITESSPKEPQKRVGISGNDDWLRIEVKEPPSIRLSAYHCCPHTFNSKRYSLHKIREINNEEQYVINAYQSLENLLGFKVVEYEGQDTICYNFTETKEFEELLNVNSDRLTQKRKEHWHTFSELLTAYIEQLNDKRKSYSPTSENYRLISLQYDYFKLVIFKHLSPQQISQNPLDFFNLEEPPEFFTKKQINQLIEELIAFKARSEKKGHKTIDLTFCTETTGFKFFNKNERTRLFSQLIGNLRNISAAFDSHDTYDLPNKEHNEENNQNNELDVKYRFS